MNEQYLTIKSRYEECIQMLSMPDIFDVPGRYQAIMQEQSELEPIVNLICELLQVESELEALAEWQSESSHDAETKALLKDECTALETKRVKLEQAIQTQLISTDPNDQRNVYLEIRGGAGGDEAALFAAVLMDMYYGYAQKKGFNWQTIYVQETGLGGLKEACFLISGRGAYSQFKYEMGVHRVQRVPITETGGRIHTSTCTVAIMPEVEDVEVEILPDDIQIDTYRASGAGGQHVNKTSSAIRITHQPTGIVVQCQDERSQHKNKDKAMKILRAKLFDLKQTAQNEEIAQHRREQVGTGDRSERIRTYNYHQSRVTDHRINLTLYKLDDVLGGDLDLFVVPLTEAEKTAEMSGSS